MTPPNDEAIRDRAYAIWEREGRPQGRERDHWLQARWELSGEEAKAAAAPKPAAKARKPAAKARKPAAKARKPAAKVGRGAGRRKKPSK